MDDPFPIAPFTSPCQGKALVPGSKSITNRALLLAALGDDKVNLMGALFSDDTRIMIDALRMLGFNISTEEESAKIIVNGLSGEIPKATADIFVGNAGTVARFLTASLCLRWGGKYGIDGTKAMRNRPMRGLLDAMQCLGGHASHEEVNGQFPIILKTSGAKGGKWEVDAKESSQILSALIMIAPLAEGDVTIILEGETVSKPFVRMTLEMCKQFMGGNSVFSVTENRYETKVSKAYSLGAENYQIEADATAASYFLALPIVTGGSCTVEGIHKDALQGDVAFLEILRKIGMLTDFSSNGAKTSRTENLQGGRFCFNAISDTFLTLAAIAPLLEGPTTITGIGHTRKQETDRIMAMANELRKLGQEVEETEDSLTIFPDIEKLRDNAKRGVKIDTYEDHRVAMSFGILGSHDILENGEAWLSIRNPSCCSKTFPGFFEEIERMRLLSFVRQ